MRLIDLPGGTIKCNVSIVVMNQLQQLREIPVDSYFVSGNNRNQSMRFVSLSANKSKG